MKKEIKYSGVSIIYDSNIWSTELADKKINRIKEMSQFASIFSALMFVLSIVVAIELKTPAIINIIFIPLLMVLPIISFTIQTIEIEYDGYESVYGMMRKLKNIDDIKLHYKNRKPIFEITYKNGKTRMHHVCSFCKKLKLYDTKITYYGEPYGKSIALIDTSDPILTNMEIKSLKINDDNYFRKKVIFYA